MCTITVIVILFVCHQSDGTFESRESLNVGTVLFLNSDIRNKKWTTNEIGLLRAREYFQHAIPPQRILYRVDEHFVDNLLDYFKTGYTAIKREARDPVTDKTMTVALSDVIGGYLKSWVLPVTKFAYYGGSISQENALNIFNFYKEVKRYLGTDGKSWSDPDPQLLNSIEVNIESPKHVFKTRSLDNPCESLAYFIKTPVGFVVPTPYVKWNDQGSTMFLPLKNDSLVALESESASSALFKYYDVAKNCIETSGQGDQDNFDERFQTWLSDDIVPHLNDDKLYTALGSVLTLLNTSNNDDGYEETFKDYFKINTCAYFHNLCNIDFSSKKTIVICLIIFLEIVWCIPTLILLLCKKSKNDDACVDSSDSSKRRRYIDGFKVQKYGKKGKYGRSGKTQTASRVQINTSDYEGLFIAEDVHNVGTMCSSVSRNSVGTCTQSFFSSKFCSADLAKIIYEGPSVTNKRPLKQIITQKSDANVLDARDIILPEIYRKFYSKSTPFEVEQSYSTNQGLEPSKTVTLLNGGTVPGVEYDTKHKACCCSEQVSSIETLKNNNVGECTCQPCFDSSSKNPIDCSNNKVSQSDVNTNICSTIESKNRTSKSTRFRIQKEKKQNKIKGIKLSNTKPYVEITIERPQNEISVGISTVTRNQGPNSHRPSKIPKRSVTAAGEAKLTCKPTASPEDRFQRKSFIPQPKKQALVVFDDIVLKNRGTSMKEKKLNVTL